jgi:hypothetical protein
MAKRTPGDLIEAEQEALFAEEAALKILPLAAAFAESSLRTWITLMVRGMALPAVTISVFQLAAEGPVLLQRGPFHSSLWVPPTYGGYASAYWNMVAAEAGYDGPKGVEGWDVDHYYAKARADVEGYGLVRLGLAKASANRSAGAATEAPIKHFEEKIAPGRRSPRRLMEQDGYTPKDLADSPNPHVRHMDELMNCKVLGFKAPGKRTGLTDAHDAYAEEISRRTGIPAEAIRRNLRELRARVTRMQAALKAVA